MKKTAILIKRMAIICCLMTIVSCNYLDIIPDNLASIENAYKNRQEAEASLYGLYSGLPYFPYPDYNPALLGGDEVWYIEKGPVDPVCWNIARGYQNVNSPLIDEWSSVANNIVNGIGASTRAVWTHIRDADTFLDLVDLATDVRPAELYRWKSEAKFLKAYYHFYLFRMYGPIPTIEKSLPINTASGSQLYREPVDDVVDFIVSLIDEALPGLPAYIQDVNREAGRATKGWAYGLKAKVLALAASPLYNGNPDYADFTDSRGIALFPQEYNPEKWQRAADAIRQAIVFAEDSIDCHLFDFRKDTNYGERLSDSTVLAMQVRGAVTEKWNAEIIWGESSVLTGKLERMCHPQFFDAQNTGGLQKCYAPPLHIVEQFYTKNGIPIEEDRSWEGIDLYGLRKGDDAHRYYIEKDFETLNLHFDREARFYGAITFDGGTYYGNGRILRDDNMWVVHMKNGEPGGGITPVERYLSTGYQCKKLASYQTSVPDNNSSIVVANYTFPLIRLADLYLLYAEALNEIKNTPDGEVYEYIDRIRARSGLEGVVESWQKYAKPEFKQKPATKDGMREIIHRERMIELSFEGARFWDLRRWKEAKTYMNKPVRGLNIAGRTTEDFYKVRTVFNLHFSDKDYLWPIRQSTLLINDNLVQNPGW
jgi:hypothetical protein